MAQHKIKRRKVFYLPGFDPRSELYYQRLYKLECKKWATTNNKSVSVSKLDKSQTEPRFSVENTTDDVMCDYEILPWHDINKELWSYSSLKLLMLTLRFYFSLNKTIDLKLLSSFGRQPTKIIFFPLISIAAIFFILLLLAFTLFISTKIFLIENLIVYFSLVAIFLCALFYASYYLIVKIKSMWTLRMLLFHQEFARQSSSPLHTRLDDFSKKVARCVNANKHDEILFVCHSYSSILAPKIVQNMSQYLNKGYRQSFSILSLANLFPLATSTKTAKSLHNALHQLADSSTEIDWLDISSPADGACYFACNPFSPVRSDAKINFVYKSPRFHAVIEESKYKALKKNRFELHFQYFCSADKNAATNYFQITAGNKPLSNVF